MSDFTLHPRLEADSLYIGNLNLCQIRLINNKNFPWALLIPRQDNLREFTDLSTSDQQQLMLEICKISTVLQQITGAEKMNIGAIGNMVSQLHIHVIARFSHDIAWPHPVWGAQSNAYDSTAATQLIAKLRQHIK
ncbi:MAG: HIT family protein [Alphaproteobacteria bacterium]|nr:HIT family protein [Alphaproteobacteria bacterium]